MHAQEHTHARTHTHMHAQAHTHAHTYIHNTHMHMHTHTYTCTCTHTYLHSTITRAPHIPRFTFPIYPRNATISSAVKFCCSAENCHRYRCQSNTIAAQLVAEIQPACLHCPEQRHICFGLLPTHSYLLATHESNSSSVESPFRRLPASPRLVSDATASQQLHYPLHYLPAQIRRKGQR